MDFIIESFFSAVFLFILSQFAIFIKWKYKVDRLLMSILFVLSDNEKYRSQLSRLGMNYDDLRYYVNPDENEGLYKKLRKII